MYGFATATAEEAFILRKAGIKKPILVLGYVFPYTYEQMIQEDIRRAEAGFLVEDCYGAATTKMRFFSPYRLITMPIVGTLSGEGHRFTVEAGYQYP